MTASQIVYDVVLLFVCVALAFLARSRLRTISGYDRRGILPSSKSRKFAIGGFIIFSCSFAWCALMLTLGLSDAGVVLVPALVMVALGWALLIASSKWMQKHTVWLVVFGVAGILTTGLWLIGSAGMLSRSNPHNFYWIFYPAITIGTASILALAAPAFHWFFRMTSVIGGD